MPAVAVIPATDGRQKGILEEQSLRAMLSLAFHTAVRIFTAHEVLASLLRMVIQIL